METTHDTTIQQAYAAFNKRDIEAALSVMTENVRWPKAWEGDYVEGYDGIRDYWTRQWKEINPMVTPVSTMPMTEDEVDVEVHQVVKDLDGNVLFDGIVHHVYTFKNGKISKMEIVQPL